MTDSEKLRALAADLDANGTWGGGITDDLRRIANDLDRKVKEDFNDIANGRDEEYDVMKRIGIKLDNLPSDEEIEDEAYEQDAERDQHDRVVFKYAFDDDQAEAFIQGAKWMRDKMT